MLELPRADKRRSTMVGMIYAGNMSQRVSEQGVIEPAPGKPMRSVSMRRLQRTTSGKVKRARGICSNRFGTFIVRRANLLLLVVYCTVLNELT